MPRKYKGRGRRRRRKGKAIKGKTLLRQARTARIDSAAERAVALIAKREAKKLMSPNLIFRRYYFADYQTATQTFSNRTPVDMAGVIVHILQIPKWDNQTLPTQVPVADADMRPQVPLYPRGANVVAPDTSKDQYRFGSQVSVKNISVELLFQFIIPPLAVPEEEKVIIKYALMQVGGDQIFAPQWAPLPRAIMPFPRPFGYSSRLDNEQAELEKVRTLKKGFVTLYPNVDNKIVEKGRKMFWTGNLPYEFNLADQNGQQVEGNKKLFLVLKSTAKLAAAQKPTVACVIKVGYRDQ